MAQRAATKRSRTRTKRPLRPPARKAAPIASTAGRSATEMSSIGRATRIATFSESCGVSALGTSSPKSTET